MIQPISWWLDLPGKSDLEVAHAVMSALREPQNGCGQQDIARSPFVTEHGLR